MILILRKNNTDDKKCAHSSPAGASLTYQQVAHRAALLYYTYMKVIECDVTARKQRKNKEKESNPRIRRVYNPHSRLPSESRLKYIRTTKSEIPPVDGFVQIFPAFFVVIFDKNKKLKKKSNARFSE